MNKFKNDFTDLALQGGGAGRTDAQWGWLDVVRDSLKGRTVLDVGCGLSKTKERLPDSIVTTHEPAPDCPADLKCPIADIEGQWDCVICNDVIEHVVEYGSFAFHLHRLARSSVFLTTPGAAATENKSPYHFHEFMPWEILQLLEATGLWFGNAWGQKWSGPCEYDGNMPKNLLTGVINLKRADLLADKFIHPVALLMFK